MREMVDDYTKQLEFRDDNIRQLEQSRPQEAALRRELDDYMHENRVLKDKNASLNRDLDQNQSSINVKSQYLKDENARLTQSLHDKERFIERQIADQKNEWAEIYGN